MLILKIIFKTRLDFYAKAFVIFLILSFSIKFSFSQESKKGESFPTNPNSPKSNTYAIVLGISDYQKLPKLDYADRDAQAFSDFLLSPLGWNLPVENVKTLLNSDVEFTKLEIYFQELTDKVKVGDKVYFFFSGHGDTEIKDTSNKNTFLLFSNCPNENYLLYSQYSPYLSSRDLDSFITNLIAKKVIVVTIIDACHSGTSGGKTGQEITTNAIRLLSSSRKFLSCEPNQTSIELKEFGQGLFSHYFLQGLYGMADNDKDGKISNYELEKYLKDNVPKEAMKHKNKDGNIHQQNPVIDATPSSEIIASVNEELLVRYKKNKTPDFLLSKMAEKSEEEDVLKVNLFKEAMESVSLNNTNRAIELYKKFESNYSNKDSLCIALKSTLINALQVKSSKVIDAFNDYMKGNNTSVYFKSSLINLNLYQDALHDLRIALKIEGHNSLLYNKLKSKELFFDYVVNYLPEKTTLSQRVKILHQSLSLDQDASYVVSHLGTEYIGTKYKDSALLYLQKYSAMIPNSSYGNFNVAEAFRSAQMYSEADSFYKIALKIDSFCAWCHNGYALLLEEMNGRTLEAEYEHKKAIGLSVTTNEQQQILTDFATFLIKERRFNEADSIIKHQLQIADSLSISTVRFFYAYFLYQFRYDSKSALQILREDGVENFKSEYPHSYTLFAMILGNQTFSQEVDKYFMKAIELAPTHFDPYLGYSKFLEARGLKGDNKKANYMRKKAEKCINEKNK